MADDISFSYDSSANSSFPAKEYLKRFSDPTTDPMQIHAKFLKAWHDFYEKYLDKMEKPIHMLEFGGGPTIYSLITAAKHVESVTFAEYAETNRNEIVIWKDKIGDFHEWSSYFKYVTMELEKNSVVEPEKSPAVDLVAQRQQVLREKLREVIPCNIKDKNILGESEIEKFDIIQSNLCLEAACESKEEFLKCIVGLKELLKPGGYLVFLTAKGGSWYTCAGSGCKLFQLKIEEEDILWAFSESGLTIQEYYPIELTKNPISTTREFQFTITQNV